ncbi:MAG: DUF2924 domain-containing protein [Phycisphaeraceae bacterium]|nr:DUF2924 domain-containing protein [Phycisphaeraceae bacterium]
MPGTIQIDALQRMTTSELAERFAELHGYPCRTRHRGYLVRKIAWRLQANAEGDLTERARRRAEELADDAQVRVMTPKTLVCPPQPGPPTTAHRSLSEIHDDPRVPPVGSAIVREYKGRTLRVIVRSDGFEWEGERYRTLSAVAKRITSSHINGFRFFRLGGQR